MDGKLTRQEELLQEHVTDSEVRELLTRLGQAELGGPEEATLGAVVEATGASPVEVGRLLGQIRQEEMDRRFSETFENHEQRIERLEKEPAKPPQTVQPAAPLFKWEMSAEDRQARTSTNLAPVIVLFAVAVAIAMIIFIARPTRISPLQRTYPYAVGVSDPARGVQIERGMDGSYVTREPDGSRRPSTESERSMADAAGLAVGR